MLRSVTAGLVLSMLCAAGAAAQPATRMDPREILFSIPTIANDLPALEPVSGQITADDFMLHEDDWRQVEFFPRRRLDEVQRMMTEYKSFEAENRTGAGWRRTFVRRLPVAPVLSGDAALADLSGQMGAQARPPPILYQSPNIVVGRATDGFSLEVAPEVWLYGQRNQTGIIVLGATVGAGGDDQALVRAFTRISARNDVILVDWVNQFILMAVASDGGLVVWSP